MNDKCSICGQSFTPEPRFYEGAMYVSYAMMVALVITVFTASVVLFEDPNEWIMIATAIGLSVLMSPITFRYSRSLWIHFFIKYRPELRSKRA